MSVNARIIVRKLYCCTGIIPVNDAVDYRHVHGALWHKTALNAVDAFIRNQASSLVCVEQINRTVHLREHLAPIISGTSISDSRK